MFRIMEPDDKLRCKIHVEPRYPRVIRQVLSELRAHLEQPPDDGVHQQKHSLEKSLALRWYAFGWTMLEILVERLEEAESPQKALDVLVVSSGNDRLGGCCASVSGGRVCHR